MTRHMSLRRISNIWALSVLISFLALTTASRSTATISASLPYDLSRRSKYYRKNRAGQSSLNFYGRVNPRTIYSPASQYKYDYINDSDHYAVLASSTTTSPNTDTSTTTATRTNTKDGLPIVDDDVSYADLSIVGKVVAGTVEVGFTILFEYAMGWLGGYFLGAITDVPRLLFTPVQQQAMQQQQNSLFKQALLRLNRMNSKSLRWGGSWGSISAAFGGFRVGAKVVRNGKEDEWTTVLSSMLAGAYFARKEGPQAMLKGALFYGGLVYLLNSSFMPKNKAFQYDDQRLDF